MLWSNGHLADYRRLAAWRTGVPAEVAPTVPWTLATTSQAATVTTVDLNKAKHLADGITPWAEVEGFTAMTATDPEIGAYVVIVAQGSC